ncbi:MAG: helix-turn-helix domain-containing protein [Methanocellales archaeon]|nr:helix-turn-helix domain-containing protein [Methanocellales archaeon]MDD3291087.1 helix-turn-helix domain-containing protein [Methanocellales archaeon]MDD3420895.1 helix-turn-helix domain-containing protein [Methanocellales archaeon]MDD5234972.1 helix-turn-helix domain-containing protein [Methanocellales archaeon]MDD5484657.1 helix-turn-helix domain-containing protein [Methanocellales archaeon]
MSAKDIRRRLAEKMAGEITLSEDPGETLKKWRKNFEISQIDLSKYLEISPSVISDYESGRRKSPGTLIVGRIVDALLELDLKKGGKKLSSYGNILRSGFDANAIYDMYEYSTPLLLENFAELIQAEKIVGNFNKVINGYTVIDSIKAILELSSNEFYRLYGWSTERALIFTKLSTGKSPMVAIRVANLKPGAVVLQGLSRSEIDMTARKIAEIEQIPLMSTTLPIQQLIEVLRSGK